MFGKIIANPPYGKRGTLATTLIKEFMKYAKECIVLCQPRSIEKTGVYEHVVKADVVDNIFDAGLGKLTVSKIRNDYTEGKQVLYGKREMNEYDIEWWIRDFNKDKQNIWRTIPTLQFTQRSTRKLWRKRDPSLCLAALNTLTQ